MKTIIFILWFTLIPGLVWAHGNENHEKKEEPSETYKESKAPEAVKPFTMESTHSNSKEEQSSNEKNESQKILLQLTETYRTEVEPIFQQKCYNCHSNQTKYPWYYNIPGIQQLINKDIEEAMEHLDMGNGFPFGGHGTPIEDLESLQQTVEKGSMPPFMYKLGHWNSALNDREVVQVLNWIKSSVNQLNITP